MALASPTGTSGSAGFGIRRSASSSSASTRPISASSAAIRSPAATDAARSDATSGPSGAAPPLIASPTCFEAAFRSCLARVGLAEELPAAGIERQRGVHERGVLALVEGSLPDDLGFVPEPLHTDAHPAASAVPCVPAAPGAPSA